MIDFLFEEAFTVVFLFWHICWSGNFGEATSDWWVFLFTSFSFEWGRNEWQFIHSVHPAFLQDSLFSHLLHDWVFNRLLRFRVSKRLIESFLSFGAEWYRSVRGESDFLPICLWEHTVDQRAGINSDGSYVRGAPYAHLLGLISYKFGVLLKEEGECPGEEFKSCFWEGFQLKSRDFLGFQVWESPGGVQVQ